MPSGRPQEMRFIITPFWKFKNVLEDKAVSIRGQLHEGQPFQVKQAWISSGPQCTWLGREGTVLAKPAGLSGNGSAVYGSFFSVASVILDLT